MQFAHQNLEQVHMPTKEKKKCLLEGNWTVAVVQVTGRDDAGLARARRRSTVGECRYLRKDQRHVVPTAALRAIPEKETINLQN